MAAIPRVIAQGEQVTLDNPRPIMAIGGSNNTPFYLKFRELPEDRRWVFPFTLSFMYPIDPPISMLHVDASQTPSGFPAAPSSTAMASLTAYDQPQGFTPGRVSAASTPATQSSVSGQVLGLNDTVTIACGGAAGVSVQLQPLPTVGMVLLAEVTTDDSFWVSTPVYDVTSGFWLSQGASLGSLNNNTVTYLVPTAGFSQMRIRLANPGLGSVNITMRATAGLFPLNTTQRPFDAQAVIEGGVGAAASAVLPATAGRRWILGAVSLSGGATAAPAAGAVRLQILDGVTVVWSETDAYQAIAGARVKLGNAPIGLIGSVGKAMSASIGGVGNCFTSASIGGWLL